MKAAGISVRTRQMLVLLISILVLVSAALSFQDSSQRLKLRRTLLEQRTQLMEEVVSLNRDIYSALPDMEAREQVQALNKINKLEQILAHHEADSLLQRQLRESLNRLKLDLGKEGDRDSLNSANLAADLDLVSKLAGNLAEKLAEKEGSLSASTALQVGITFFLGIFILGLVFGLNAYHINDSLKKLLKFSHRLSKGSIPPPLGQGNHDEFGILAEDLNKHVEDLHEKLRYIRELSGEGSFASFRPGEEDEMGKELLKLSETITSKELEEVTRNREDKKQNWIAEGAAQMGEVLRSHREDPVELSYAVIQKLVIYMNIEMGALYIAGQGEVNRLNLVASHAYDRRKYRDEEVDWGAGLPGTCAREKQRIYMTDVPEDYFEISSGTGAARPNCLLLVPLLRDNAVFGVIELATVRLLRPFEIAFVESLSESIASSLYAVQTNEQTAELLRQSQAQGEIMKAQEKAMMESMKQLEEAQEESTKKETEIRGILTAINQSALVAELGINRRYLSINDNFLNLLGTQREMILGKLHSDIARVDPYTDEYKSFWKELKEGSSKTNTEAYRVIEEKEIWLRQSFTPILNQEGKVYKILNIATDISENRSLQEALAAREEEIGRSQLDMKSLNQAVNSALIKTELDKDGIITEANDKYLDISGYGPKEVLGRNMRLFLKPAEKEQFEKIWEVVVMGRSWEGVIHRTRPTGEEFWMAATFSPVLDGEGRILKVYLMAFDITEKKLKYQLLEEANREIERLKEMLKEHES